MGCWMGGGTHRELVGLRRGIRSHRGPLIYQPITMAVADAEERPFLLLLAGGLYTVTVIDCLNPDSDARPDRICSVFGIDRTANG